MAEIGGGDDLGRMGACGATAEEIPAFILLVLAIADDTIIKYVYFIFHLMLYINTDGGEQISYSCFVNYLTFFDTVGWWDHESARAGASICYGPQCRRKIGLSTGCAWADNACL